VRRLQLSLLDCEDELLAVAGAVQIAFFPEASREYLPGPYDLTLVEGSITTPHDLEQSRRSGPSRSCWSPSGLCHRRGIQGAAELEGRGGVHRYVYAHPDYISTLDTSTPVSEHVAVDFELRGCPINKWQLVELVNALLHTQAQHPHLLGLRRVQAARHGLRDWWPMATPVSAGHPGRVQRPLPGLQPGMLRCYGLWSLPTCRPSASGGDRWGWTTRTLVNALRSFNAYAQPFRRPVMSTPSKPETRAISVDYLARVEGEGT